MTEKRILMRVIGGRNHKIVTLPTRFIACVGIEIEHHPLRGVLVKRADIAAGLDVEIDVFSVFRDLCQLKIVASGGVFERRIACIVGIIAVQDVAFVVAIFGCYRRPLLHVTV